MQLLRFTSCQAPSMDAVCRALATYLGERLPQQVQIQFVAEVDWQERYRQLDTGQLQVAWICGSHYVRRVDTARAKLELLAAPVWQAARYAGQPVYFSDIIVHCDSQFHTFADLQGATWAYNEPGSLSGYEAMRYYLAKQGKSGHFFGKVIEAGAHQRALAMLLARQADVAAIDSTVFEQALQAQPELSQQFRVIDTIGPNPMPPWVVSLNVPPVLRQTLRHILCHMQTNSAGRALLEQGAMLRFTPVVDQAYEPVRQMLRLAETITIPAPWPAQQDR